MLPAYLANMTPPLVRFWKGWNRPISRKWLGDHKTVVGLGQSWIPMDQLDFVVGALALVSPWAPVTGLDMLTILVFSFAGDIAINHLSYALGIRDTKW